MALEYPREGWNIITDIEEKEQQLCVATHGLVYLNGERLSSSQRLTTSWYCNFETLSISSGCQSESSKELKELHNCSRFEDSEVRIDLTGSHLEWNHAFISYRSFIVRESCMH